MNREWFVVTGGRQYGPFTRDEVKLSLQERRCTPADLFWRQDMPEWMPLPEIADLSDLAATIPPQPPIVPPLPGQLTTPRYFVWVNWGPP